jgi:hypothetical protein
VTNITDQAIYALVDASDSEAPLLERVHLSFCDNLSVGAITHLLKHIPKITHLSLTGVSAFRDRQYQTFCRSPPAVRSSPSVCESLLLISISLLLSACRNSMPINVPPFVVKAFPIYEKAC